MSEEKAHRRNEGRHKGVKRKRRNREEKEVKEVLLLPHGADRGGGPTEEISI